MEWTEGDFIRTPKESVCPDSDSINRELTGAKPLLPRSPVVDYYSMFLAEASGPGVLRENEN
jgi:hypothetical protein